MRKTAKKLKEADGGYASRKLWYSVATSCFVVALGCLAAFWPAFRPSLETVIGGVVGTLALYLGANVTGRWSMLKTGGYEKPEQPEEPKDEDKPEPKQPVEPLPE